MKYSFLLVLILAFATGCQSFEDRSERARLTLQVGTSMYDNGRYPEALREILKAYKLDPRNPAIANALGLTYHARGRSDLGIKYLQEALQIDPNYTEARNNLARIYIETKDFASAQKQLQLVKKDLTYTAVDKVYINEGLLYYDQGKFQQALDPFSKAINYARENCAAHHLYGKSLFQLKQYAAAAAALDRAIVFCEKAGSDESHYLSAISYYRAGDKRKSAVRFEELTKLYPNGPHYEKSKSLLEIVKKEL